MPDFVLSILITVGLLVLYSAALFLAICRHRYQQSRNRERENEDAPN